MIIYYSCFAWNHFVPTEDEIKLQEEKKKKRKTANHSISPYLKKGRETEASYFDKVPPGNVSHDDSDISGGGQTLNQNQLCGYFPPSSGQAAEAESKPSVHDFAGGFMQNPSIEDHLERAGVTDIADLVKSWKDPMVDITTWNDVMNVYSEAKVTFDSLIMCISIKSQVNLQLYVQCYYEAKHTWKRNSDYDTCCDWLIGHIIKYQYYVSDNHSCHFLMFCSELAIGNL